ncbi:MAG: hypothetical protein JO357_00390 [Hyphomicrobiales bacterium]|nr:hypothetical protein [Hyphomicrobiales bacterium]MBV9135488.1 hypothetical protein [Hyphomicrobiales bacterium]MBV9518827.1 hypothetical protein [Hyphomicrobiales bacterium]
MSKGLHMRCPHEWGSDVSEHVIAPEEFGRLANLGLLLVVLILSALWLAFPPAQLSWSSATGPMLTQGAHQADDRAPGAGRPGAFGEAGAFFLPQIRALPLPLAGEGAPHAVRGG